MRISLSIRGGGLLKKDRALKFQTQPKRSQTRVSFVSHRLYRIVALGLCCRKYRLDTFISERFLPYLVSDRLCYLLVWFNRAVRIPRWLVGSVIRIFRGRKWRGLRPRHFYRGYRLGQFARTRTLAVFQQAKTRKKKAKAAAAKAAAAASQARIEMARRLRGRKGGRPGQGLKKPVKALIGTKWLSAKEVFEVAAP